MTTFNRTFVIERGIPRRINQAPSTCVFRILAPNLTMAKLMADDLAIAVGEHRGNFGTFSDKGQGKKCASNWALNNTTKLGQKSGV